MFADRISNMANEGNVSDNIMEKKNNERIWVDDKKAACGTFYAYKNVGHRFAFGSSDLRLFLC